MKRVLVGVALAGALWGATAQAAVNVVLNSVSPGETITLNGHSDVHAGIYNLTVNGVPTPSFCIDVVHNSTTGTTYTDYSFVPLADAPNSPAGPMGAAAAHTIEGLWGTYFAGATTGAEAAALQVAIWTAVHNANPGGSSLNFGADAITTAAVTRANQMLGSLTTFANLEGLVGGPLADEQGFVVVPEPTTVLAAALLLLPFGANTLKVLRKKQLS